MTAHNKNTTTTTDDVCHKNPLDNHLNHVWFQEPAVAQGVLTQDGVTQIAHHKYVSGTYTDLDIVLNPLWQGLTDMLPMWLAPNAITSVGGLWCLASYLVAWYYNPHLVGDGEQPGGAAAVAMIPAWVLIFNGLAQMVYYTLDSIDGKQARRTGSSSPLGQLFDHGMDCLCILSHLSLVQCVLELQHPSPYIWLQCSLQFAFFQAQWEEYYTGILPHATGNVGVTETNYGLAVFSMVSGLGLKQWGVFEMNLLDGKEGGSIASWLPLQTIILGRDTASSDPLQVRDLFVVLWVYMMSTLCLLSLVRVARHLKFHPWYTLSALSKLCSPATVCVAALIWFPHLPTLRFASLSLGLCLCWITIKMIVFSMARMAYAMIQVDVLPLIVVAAIYHHHDSPPSFLYDVLCLYYLIRVVYWTRQATSQLCDRLNVLLFRIPFKKE
jgi:ethanolaminephosphotransferase